MENDSTGRLTAREQEVLTKLCQAKATKTIACELEISPETVKFHVRNIYRKLGVTNRVEAVLVGQESYPETGNGAHPQPSS